MYANDNTPRPIGATKSLVGLHSKVDVEYVREVFQSLSDFNSFKPDSFIYLDVAGEGFFHLRRSLAFFDNPKSKMKEWREFIMEHFPTAKISGLAVDRLQVLRVRFQLRDGMTRPERPQGGNNNV